MFLGFGLYIGASGFGVARGDWLLRLSIRGISQSQSGGDETLSEVFFFLVWAVLCSDWPSFASIKMIDKGFWGFYFGGPGILGSQKTPGIPKKSKIPQNGRCTNGSAPGNPGSEPKIPAEKPENSAENHIEKAENHAEKPPWDPKTSKMLLGTPLDFLESSKNAYKTAEFLGKTVENSRNAQEKMEGFLLKQHNSQGKW